MNIFARMGNAIDNAFGMSNRERLQIAIKRSQKGAKQARHAAYEVGTSRQSLKRLGVVAPTVEQAYEAAIDTAKTAEAQAVALTASAAILNARETAVKAVQSVTLPSFTNIVADVKRDIEEQEDKALALADLRKQGVMPTPTVMDEIEQLLAETRAPAPSPAGGM